MTNMAKKSKKHIRYYCSPSLNKECTKEGCFLNGGPCCCTTDPKYAARTLERIDRMNFKLVAAVANDDVADVIAQLSGSLSSQEFYEQRKQYGLEGMYINACVISQKDFITTVAGPEAYAAYNRGAITLEDYAAAHNMRYTDAAKLSRKGDNANYIYCKYCRMSLKMGITGILIHYYGAKLDAPQNLRTRVAGVFERNFFTLDRLLNASEEDIANLMNIGKTTLPYALKLQKDIREAVKRENIPRIK